MLKLMLRSLSPADLKGTYYIHFWAFVFDFWTPIEQLHMIAHTESLVDLRDAVLLVVSLPCISCIPRKQSV